MLTRLTGFARALEPRTALTTADAIRFAMWPLAILTALHRTLIQAVNGDRTNDFGPVYQAALAFMNHRPVYAEDLSTVRPHYLYPPSGTLLMAPVSVLDPARSRFIFIVANAIAIAVAGYLLLRLFKLGLDAVAAPVLLFAMFASETVVNTLTFGNINGFVLLAEMAFLNLILARRDLWAGLAIGLTFAIKPTLAPLLLIPAVRRQWKVFGPAIGVPVALNAVAWPLITDSTDYLRHTLHYSVAARDYYNSSIVGNGMYFGLPTWLIWALRIVMAALVVASLWLLYRYHRRDELFFVTTTAGVLMIATFLISSLGQQYYSMFAFPLLMSVVLPNSTIRNWPAWLAVFGFMTWDKWLLFRDPDLGRNIEYLRITLGWSLMLVVIFCVLGDRRLAARRRGPGPDGVPQSSIEHEGRIPDAGERAATVA